MFPTEISKFLPHREVDFSIELVPGVAPTSKIPSMMSTLELVELKLQLKALQQKMALVRGKKCHHKLIGDGQKSIRHQKLNVAKGGVTKSIGFVVKCKFCHQ